MKSGWNTKPLTIKGALDTIERREFLLPRIQREIVWGTDEIKDLFDSILRNMPFGSFLFWTLEKGNLAKFRFNEFATSYNEYDGTILNQADVRGKEKVTAVLDGQQRLTALYIALKGTYAEHLKGKRWAKRESYPERKLYLNLLQKRKPDEEYELAWKRLDIALPRDDSHYWFELGEILNLSTKKKLEKFLAKENLTSKAARETLERFRYAVHEDKLIQYYDVRSKYLREVLDIFIRTNSGGVELELPDIFMSILSAQWQHKDVKQMLQLLIKDLRNTESQFRFKFRNRFVLKSGLVLSDIQNIAFRVDNFTAKNVDKMKEKWDDIEQALRLSVKLVATFGYREKNFRGKNPLIPIAYYLFQKGNPPQFIDSLKYKSDREAIREWLALSLMKGVFAGQSDKLLKQLRQIIQENPGDFPLTIIKEKFKGERNDITFTSADIEKLVRNQYGESKTFAILSLLYGNRVKADYEVDHIHAKKFFNWKTYEKCGVADDDHQFYWNHKNGLANLQLLPQAQNREKLGLMLVDWLNKYYSRAKERKGYKRVNFIPSQESLLPFDKFKEFYQKRERMLRKALSEQLISD